MVETYSRPRSSGSSYEDYPRGYEPSAPPYHSAPDYHPSSAHASPADEFEQRLHRRQEDEFPRNPREPFFGPADEHETLGSYLVHRLIQPVWRGSRTVLRIDLSRSLKYNGPVVGRGRGGGVGGPSGASASVGGRDYYDGKEFVAAHC